MQAEDFQGKRITVMGLGLFGGGAGVARFLVENGAELTVTDQRSEKDLRPSMEALVGLPIRYVLGRHDVKDFLTADMLIVNPGVPSDSPYVVMARGAGVRIEREINLVFQFAKTNPILGITGSNGKSTTTAMLGEIIKIHDSRARIGGNIGSSLLPIMPHIPKGAPLVLELSSFMLDGLRDLEVSPSVSIVTNLSPNHLDRHGTVEHYYGAKRCIIDYQKQSDTAVLNADDPEVVKWAEHCKGKVIWFSTRSVPEGDAVCLIGDKLVARIGGKVEWLANRSTLRLPGLHNIANALAASAAALAYGVKPALIAEALSHFCGLPHRLEMVATSTENVRYYNDSIATTPESVICALSSFECPITLIAGGYDKGTPFDELGRVIAGRARRVILLGKTAAKIEECVRRAGHEQRRMPEIYRVNNLDEAAELAHKEAIRGEAVLLSPACASFDMFKNFQERGDIFRTLARKLAAVN